MRVIARDAIAAVVVLVVVVVVVVVVGEEEEEEDTLQVNLSRGGEDGLPRACVYVCGKSSCMMAKGN